MKIHEKHTWTRTSNDALHFHHNGAAPPHLHCICIYIELIDWFRTQRKGKEVSHLDRERKSSDRSINQSINPSVCYRRISIQKRFFGKKVILFWHLSQNFNFEKQTIQNGVSAFALAAPTSGKWRSNEKLSYWLATTTEKTNWFRAWLFFLSVGVVTP